MKIIADSGSTNTQWALIYIDKVETISTIGLNPYHVSPEETERVINDEVAIHANERVDGIYFYGSGITPQKQKAMKEILILSFYQNAKKKHLPFLTSTEFVAESDMLGAARALFGDREGIACILGTGANSCHYDGNKIVANTPALGYILGDEGSGACIGKHLVNALYKNPALVALRQELEEEYSTSMADIIERVYRQPMANRFLASLAPFARKHIDNDDIKAIIHNDFTTFFRRNLSPYPKGLNVGFVGSIAHHFEPQLRAVATAEGYDIANIAQSPLNGLIKYHSK